MAPSEIQKRDFKIKTISDTYPEYYILRINQFNDIAKDSLDEWIYFLKNEEIESSFKARGLNEAKEVLDVLKLDPKDRLIYEREEENRRYKESLLYTAEKKGLKKGLELGREEGIKEGIEKGEKKKALEIAKNLLESGVDIKLIMQSTGLSEEEIKKLEIKGGM